MLFRTSETELRLLSCGRHNTDPQFLKPKRVSFRSATPNIDLSVVSSECGHKTTSLVSSRDDV